MPGPRPFPTGTTIVQSGQTGSSVITASAAAIGAIVNAGTASSPAISIYNAATTGTAAAANRILNAVVLTAGQSLPLNIYCNVGIVIQFGSALTDNMTVTYTPLNGGA